MTGKLTLGPILFHWPAEKKRDFYYRIADEAPIDTVYLGEVVCSKRTPFFESYYPGVVERLEAAGKKIVFSSLAEVMIARERKMTTGLCETMEFQVEANDASALFHLRGRPHRVGQYFNVYNEETLAHLVRGGATHISLPAELPGQALRILGKAARQKKIDLEVQVFGRAGLALSARCYHARAHGRVKDNCQFVCENDPDGMPLKTLDEQDFLCINGVQTLSYACLNLIQEINDLQSMGIKYFRLSPQDTDMVAIARCFDDMLSRGGSVETNLRALAAEVGEMPFCNGFYHGKDGYLWLSH